MRAYRTVAKALPCQSRANVSDDSNVCVAPKLYGRVGTVATSVSRPNCADVSDGS